MCWWGNREPGNHIHIIPLPNACSYPNFAHLAQVWNTLSNLVVRTFLIPITNTCFGQHVPLPLDAMLATHNSQIDVFWSRCPHLGHLAWLCDCRGPQELLSGVLSDPSSVVLPSSTVAAKRRNCREFHAIQYLSKLKKEKSGQLIK